MAEVREVLPPAQDTALGFGGQTSAICHLGEEPADGGSPCFTVSPPFRLIKWIHEHFLRGKKWLLILTFQMTVFLH